MSTKQLIRDELLKRRPYGATASELSDLLGINNNLVQVTLRGMADAYIYKWQLTPEHHSYVAVWKCVAVPANAVRPKVEPKSRKEYDKLYKRKRKAQSLAAAAEPKPEPAEYKPKTVWVTPPPWSH